MLSTKELIDDWYKTYCEYMFHHNIHDRVYMDECFVSITNSLMDYWHKQQSGEVQKIWTNFTRFLIDHTNQYKRINENYRRNARMDVKVKSAGGRYWK